MKGSWNQKYNGSSGATSQLKFDVVVYGATPSGCSAAVRAARAGASVVIIEPSDAVGGMMSGGLSWTDVDNTKGGNLLGDGCKELFRIAGRRYGKNFNKMFEAQANAMPSIFESTFDAWLKSNGVVVVLNSYIVSIEKVGTEIKSITTNDGSIYQAAAFVDSTYEGDLLAAAGCSFTLGREANATYGETNNGIRSHAAPGTSQFPIAFSAYNTPGDSGSGLLRGVWDVPYGTVSGADPTCQAFTYRLIMTTDVAKKVPVPEPTSYDPLDYEIFGRYAAASGAGWTSLSQLTQSNALADGKSYDVNNNGSFGIDYVGPENTEYISATPNRRAEILLLIKNYVLGWFKFIKEDPRFPIALKTDVANWGFVNTEFESRYGFSRSLYVREDRRLVGDFVMREQDLTAVQTYTDGIAFINYPTDSHIVRRLNVAGEVKNEGGFFITAIKAGNPIPVRVILPKTTECNNLLVTFAMSSTHVAFSSMRMEPTGLDIGWAAGFIAAYVAAHKGVAVQSVPIAEIQRAINWRGEYVDGVGVYIPIDGSSNAIITPTGTWANITPSPNPFKSAHYKWSTTAGSKLSVQPKINESGLYDVYLQAPDDSGTVWSKVTNITVNHAGGTSTFKLNQLMSGGNGGAWIHLGQWVFQGAVAPAVVSVHTVDISVDASAVGTTAIAGLRFKLAENKP